MSLRKGRYGICTNEHYTAEIGAAYEYGIINGVTANQFAPNKTIKRQESMTIILRLLQKSNLIDVKVEV